MEQVHYLDKLFKKSLSFDEAFQQFSTVYWMLGQILRGRHLGFQRRKYTRDEVLILALSFLFYLRLSTVFNLSPRWRNLTMFTSLWNDMTSLQALATTPIYNFGCFKLRAPHPCRRHSSESLGFLLLATIQCVWRESTTLLMPITLGGYRAREHHITIHKLQLFHPHEIWWSLALQWMKTLSN